MLITNARVATLGEKPRLIDNGAILISDTKLIEIGSSQQLCAAFPNEEIVDAQGQLALPASLCGHTHFYGAFARGWAFPGPPPQRFSEILERLWWRLDKALTAEDIRYSALICLADAIRHGTTTLIDHQSNCN